MMWLFNKHFYVNLLAFLKLLLLLPFVAIVQAEVDFTGGRIAPYAPTGWHPQIPFNLPNEYVPAIRSSQGVEITKARVDQFDPVEKPQPNYLPPNQLDIPEEEILLHLTTVQQVRSGRSEI